MRISHNRRSRLSWLCLVALAVLSAAASGAVASGEAPGSKKASVGRWLVLGPVTVPFPAFNDEGPAKIGATELLEYEHVSIRDLLPVEGAGVQLLGPDAAWVAGAADSGGVVLASPGKNPGAAFLAAYVEVPRWMKIDVELRSTRPSELFIDGVSRVKQKASQKTGGGKADGAAEAGKVPAETATAKLRQGKHVLVVKTVSVPGDTAGDWRVDVRLAPSKGFAETHGDSAVLVSLDPARKVTIGDVLEGPNAEDVRICPDGRFVAIRMSKRSPGEGKREEWIEVRRFKDAGIVRTFRDLSDVSDWQWAPRGHRLSYVATKDDAGTLRVHDLDTGEMTAVVEGVKGLSGYAWSPDGNFVVYTVRKEPDKDESGVKRLREVRDRQEGARDETHLYLATVPQGMTRRVTAGRYSAFIYDVHPDGRSVLVGRSYEDLSERPYDETQLVRVSLEDHTSEVLWSGRFLGGASWSPDGKKILVTAGPSAFGGVGLAVPEGMTPNDYDTQAYLFDPAAKTAEPLTRDFDPAIASAFWPRKGNAIYFVADEADYVRLFRYDVGRRSFERIEVGCDVIHDADTARESGDVAMIGSSADRPARLHALDAGRSKARVFLDHSAGRFRFVETGRVEDWDFVSRAGREIAGRVHYPRDFDPAREWPCIVYYYGGTSPVERNYGGRYPMDLWTAHGYVVYVLQPSGATGFGQEFSAAHVNDWGGVVSGEIIEGTKNFLEAHPFVDPHRVGCIGASFGGFMTQLLVTRTNIFAAAVSHAGISSISSYWGEGYWGYAYNGVSAAESFPWNRRDIYVDRSPLFSADKVATPLLLLHGAADTNVPPGESEQMYTALKLLGRDVEYLRVEGQNHFVLDYKKRIVWSDAILSWFDKWLKDEPEWWDDAYPPVDEDGKKTPGKIDLQKTDMEKYGTVLFGKVTREDVSRNIENWDAEYGSYVPDSAAVDALRERLRGVRVVCVFGTWCSDSRREVPRLWKVLDAAGYPSSRIDMYAVGSSRFTKEMGVPEAALEWSKDVKAWYDVAAVATIVVSRGGKEFGRIVEKAEGSLEEDILRFLED